MPFKYRCDACGNCVCYSHPKEGWGVPNVCLYDVGFPVNWRKVRSTRRKAAAAKRSHNTGHAAIALEDVRYGLETELDIHGETLERFMDILEGMAQQQQ